MLTSPSTIPHFQSSKSCISECQNSESNTSTLWGTDCLMQDKKSSCSSSKQIMIKRSGCKKLMNYESMPRLLPFFHGLVTNSINGEERASIFRSQSKLSAFQSRRRVGEKQPSRVIPDFGNACIPKRGYGIQSLPFQKKDRKSEKVRDSLNAVCERLRQRLDRQLQQWQRELEQHRQRVLRPSCPPALHLQPSICFDLHY